MPGKAFLFLKVFMEFFIYVLYSASSNVYYIGHTNDFIRRFHEHNNSEHTSYTSKHRPWVLKAVYACGNIKSDAVRIERFIKKQKSRILIEKLIEGIELMGILAQLVRVPHVRD
jgi:putative endonuclease